MPLLSEANDFSREQLEKFAGGKAQTGLEGQERFELIVDITGRHCRGKVGKWQVCEWFDTHWS